MKRYQLVLLALVGLAGFSYADRVNPTANVMADSANSASTIVYRDSNGDHASRDVTVRSIIPSDTSASRNHIPVISSTTLNLTVTNAGDLFLVQTGAGVNMGVCVSSGGATANNVVYSSGTQTPCRTTL